MIPKVKYYGPRIPSTYAVNMTAAASGSNGITVADDDDIDFGTGDFFIHWEGSLPDWTPASSLTLIRKNTSAVTAGFIFGLSSSSLSLFLQIRDGGAFDTAYSSGVATGLSDGVSAKCTVTFARQSASSTGTISFYVNGLLLGSPVTVSAAAATNISNALALYVSGTSTVRNASNTISCIVGNFAPTASEVLDLCTNGIPASWKWGSQTPVKTFDFSAGADGFVGGTATLTGNIDGIGGVDNTLRVVATGTANVRPQITLSGINQRSRSKFRVYMPSSNVTAKGVFIVLLTSGGSPSVGGTVVQLTPDTWTEINQEVSAAGQNTWSLYMVNASGSTGGITVGDTMYIESGGAITKIGATMALLPDTIPTSSATTWSDTSGNTGGGTLPAAGATKVTIRR